MVKSLIDDAKVGASLNAFVDYSNADAPPTSLKEGLSLVVLG